MFLNLTCNNLALTTAHVSLRGPNCSPAAQRSCNAGTLDIQLCANVKSATSRTLTSNTFTLSIMQQHISFFLAGLSGLMAKAKRNQGLKPAEAKLWCTPTSFQPAFYSSWTCEYDRLVEQAHALPHDNMSTLLDDNLSRCQRKHKHGRNCGQSRKFHDPFADHRPCPCHCHAGHAGHHRPLVRVVHGVQTELRQTSHAAMLLLGSHKVGHYGLQDQTSV